MRSLHVLLAGFGALMGLLSVAVAFLAQPSTPVRVNFGYAGDHPPQTDRLASASLGSLPIYLVAALPLLGALLGWLCGFIATRFGWRLSRNSRA